MWQPPHLAIPGMEMLHAHVTKMALCTACKSTEVRAQTMLLGMVWQGVGFLLVQFL